MASIASLAGAPMRVRRARRLDAVGGVLLALTGVWTLVTSVDRADARPWPAIALLVAMAVGFALARRVASPEPTLVPGVVAVGVTGAFVLGYPALLSAGGGPTGYGNSNATLAALGAVAAGAAAASSRMPRQRQAWVALALLLGAGVPLAGSLAASLALALAAGLALVTVLTREVAVAVVGGAMAVWLSLGLTTAIAAGGDPAGLGARSELRGELWAEGLETLRDEPWRGVGTGSYALEVRGEADHDLRWAHHGVLQQGAEQGLIGLGLMLAVAAWGYTRLWAGRRRSRARTVAGAAALTIVALHAMADHVLHQAAVPITMAVLVGWATADLRDPGTLGSRRPLR